MRLLATLLFAAAPAVAQVRAVAPAAEAGAASAAAAAPSAFPLGYALALQSPAPSLSPALVGGALGLSDWRQVLTSYDDPRELREAILSREESPAANDPALLLRMVDRAPALAAKRRLYEEAVLDWSVFSEETRAALAKAGAPESVWTTLTLPERYETFRRVFQEIAGRMITVEPGDPAFAAQYEKALRRVSAVMTDEELAGHQAALARARAAAERTAAALSCGNAAPEAPEPSYDLSPAETKALLARLTPAIAGELRGTPSGYALLAELSGGGLSLAVGETSRDGALATYREDSSSIVLGSKQLAELLAALGRTPRDLLSDDETLADAAALYSHLFVHEATHHRQELWARRLPAGARRLAYNQASEIEANGAQAKYLREKRAADPAFAAREARLRGVWGMVAAVMRQPEILASDPAAMRSWLTTGYRHVPTLARSGARLIGYGIAADRRDAALASRADAELARRARLPVAERLDLGREDRDASGGFESLDTRELRRLRAALRGQARAMVAAAAAMTERARVEIARLK
ncbi:MAG TPA: hypothetical protein VN915_01370 [Elusimicrobiota bacterium]|nr:hypothetical protein [Elusimicrobiota bacterium]